MIHHLTANAQFISSLMNVIDRLGEAHGIAKDNRLVVALEAVAHDRRAEVGMERLAGEMQRIQVELLLDAVQDDIHEVCAPG